MDEEAYRREVLRTLREVDHKVEVALALAILTAVMVASMFLGT